MKKPDADISLLFSRATRECQAYRPYPTKNHHQHYKCLHKIVGTETSYCGSTPLSLLVPGMFLIIKLYHAEDRTRDCCVQDSHRGAHNKIIAD